MSDINKKIHGKKKQKTTTKKANRKQTEHFSKNRENSKHMHRLICKPWCTMQYDKCLVKQTYCFYVTLHTVVSLKYTIYITLKSICI